MCDCIEDDEMHQRSHIPAFVVHTNVKRNYLAVSMTVLCNQVSSTDPIPRHPNHLKRQSVASRANDSGLDSIATN